MNAKNHLSTIALCGALAIALGGCAVARDQETVGAYVEDAAVTTKVKAKLAEDSEVSAAAIGVETLNGTVELSGFAKSRREKEQAERLARATNGVRAVRNDVIIRP